ncbi:hypothetical protein U9M48_037459 [Paspalum notatum var. saurae]|uniref:Uncharacterized protein n=1 Tax=Paspalum notatum var. saurae TaxID=547442 RepID=A0AAQ3UJC5_PASNO
MRPGQTRVAPTTQTQPPSLSPTAALKNLRPKPPSHRHPPAAGRPRPAPPRHDEPSSSSSARSLSSAPVEIHPTRRARLRSSPDKSVCSSKKI